jgi:hypothetical protein
MITGPGVATYRETERATTHAGNGGATVEGCPGRWRPLIAGCCCTGPAWRRPWPDRCRPPERRVSAGEESLDICKMVWLYGLLSSGRRQAAGGRRHLGGTKCVEPAKVLLGLMVLCRMAASSTAMDPPIDCLQSVQWKVHALWWSTGYWHLGRRIPPHCTHALPAHCCCCRLAIAEVRRQTSPSEVDGQLGLRVDLGQHPGKLKTLMAGQHAEVVWQASAHCQWSPSAHTAQPGMPRSAQAGRQAGPLTSL